MAVYTDKHSVFRVNAKNCVDSNITQFGRGMQELGIELIHASSPQAKGRVERANSTLQDRLIKMMRLDGISSMDEANAYTSKFIKYYNQKFAKPPKSSDNARCPIKSDENLKEFLCIKTSKHLSRSLSFQQDLKLYQVTTDNKYRLQNKSVTLCERYDKESFILYQDETLVLTYCQLRKNLLKFITKKH